MWLESYKYLPWEHHLCMGWHKTIPKLIIDFSFLILLVLVFIYTDHKKDIIKLNFDFTF
jgi:hypothetical protein